MEDKQLFIYSSIVSGMQEGVFTINMNGCITYMNASAMKILQLDKSVIGKKFAMIFFADEQNDSFCQAIIDAVYHDTTAHNAIVDFVVDGEVHRLFMSTSYLKDGDEKIGITAVINDITELHQLRDAVKAMEHIRALNAELEKRNNFIKKTFGRYLSDDIVKTILDTDNGLDIGGKKQDVTIMFTDLRGFTALSEKIEPHALIGLLNAYLERMIEIIMAHKGTILEFIGDAIVAVFGAPLESNTHDSDAVACAIDMQCAMEDVNRYNLDHGYPEIEMGIGIHTGDVVLGNIGSSKKTKYDIIGKNVNLASRIETYSVGGEILISPVIQAKLADRLVTGKTIDIIPKGVKEPITIYEVKGLDGKMLPDNQQIFRTLDKPVEIVLYPLEGKHKSENGAIGFISEVSEKEFVLKTGLDLPESTTVSFDFGGECIYAKVIGKQSGGILLHITSGKLKI